MMKNNTTTEHDFYEDFYATNLKSPITIILFLYGLVTGIAAPISVIWFERNCGNHFRTVINQMLAAASWYCLIWTLLVYIPDGLRFVYGPFGEVFCDIHLVTKDILWPGLILTEDVMIVLRYIFVYHFKNFGIINDDLVARILNLSIVTIAIWASAVRRLSPGKFPLYYYLCTGNDPNEDQGIGTYMSISPKYNAGRIIVVFSLILHIFIVPRFIYTRILTKIKERPIRIGILQPHNQENSTDRVVIPNNRNNQPIMRRNNVTLFGLFIQLVALGILLLFGIGMRNSLNVEPDKWNKKEYYWIPMTVLIYAPVLLSTSGLIFFFTQNSQLRSSMKRKVQTLLNIDQS